MAPTRPTAEPRGVFPEPTTAIFHTRDDLLGAIPGPLYLDAFEGTLWVAGGAWGRSVVLRRVGGKWERCSETGANGLRSVLALSHDSAILSGELGFIARTEDGGRGFQRIPTNTKACLYSISEDADGTIWIGGDPGGLFRSHDKGWTFSGAFQPPPGRNFRVVRANKDFLVNEHRLATILRGKIDTIFSDSAVMNDVAQKEDGSILLVANDGKAWVSLDSRRFDPVDVGTRSCIERVKVIDGRFIVLCEDGSLRASPDGIAWSKADVKFVESGLCLRSLVPYQGGWLVAGDRQVERAFVGALYYLGPTENAPVVTG